MYGVCISMERNKGGRKGRRREKERERERD
jgi:hypothetical protein